MDQSCDHGVNIRGTKFNLPTSETKIDNESYIYMYEGLNTTNAIYHKEYSCTILIYNK